MAVALLAEGVDRNHQARVWSDRGLRSPSSRRAWIEIFGSLWLNDRSEVALLAEGVDRNNLLVYSV